MAQVSDVVVAAGLRWLVTFEPRALLSRLASLQVPLIEASRLATFERSVGFRAGETSQAAIAGFDYSTLYVVRLVPDDLQKVHMAAARFAARLDETPVRQEVVRVALLSGVRQGLPHHFAQLDELSVGWSEGDPSTLKAAALAAQLRLRAAPALRGASLSLLPPTCRDGDLVLYVPGPVTPRNAPDEPASGVLASVLAASIAFELNGETLDVSGCVVGDWDDRGVERLQLLLDAVLSHRFVSLLALSDAERQPTLNRDGDVVHFEFAWRADHVFARARALLELDLTTLLAATR